MTIPAKGIPAKGIPNGKPVAPATTGEKPKRVRKTDKVSVIGE
jgi:hypothetical protein